MALIAMPAELTKAYWDRKKGAVAAGSPLDNELKAFEKKLQAVDWRSFDPGWEKKASDAKALDAAWTALERTYRAKVVPLKSDAQSVAEAAQKLLKDKALPKPTLEAAKTVIDEAKAFGKAVEAALAALNELHDDAARALEDAAGADGEDERMAELLDPGVLHRSLEMCRKTPGRRLNFAFVSDGKMPAALVLSPRAAGRKLFSSMTEAIGVRTGGYGEAWFEEGILYLMMDKPFAGIVKKISGPLKTAQFKVSKVLLVEAGGQVVEQDEEADDAVAPEAASHPAAAASPERSSAAYAGRLAELMPRVRQAQSDGSPVAAKIQPLLDFAHAKAESGNEAAALQALQTLDKLLASAPSSAPGGASAEVAPPAAEWARQRAPIEARVGAALAGEPPEASKLRAVFAFAVDKAQAGQFDKAIAALAPLEGLLAAIEARAGSAAATSGAKAPADLIGLWTTAKEEVDERINALRSALLKHGDADLARIADEGITAAGLAFLTGGRLVELTASLTELRGKATVDPVLGGRASRAAAELKAFLANDGVVAMCEDNPVTGSLGIRSSLIPALEQIESLLAA